MTIYTIDEDLKIVSDSYDVANLEAFEREMYESYPDGWYDNEEDAFNAVEEIRKDLISDYYKKEEEAYFAFFRVKEEDKKYARFALRLPNGGEPILLKPSNRLMDMIRDKILKFKTFLFAR